MSGVAAAKKVVSESARKTLLVLGGSGYVGQNICHAAVASGKFDVVQSVSRSGRPSNPNDSSLALDQVEWIKGDIFDEVFRKDVLSEVDAVMSTVGAFGSNEFMERVCGDATILAVQTAAESSNVSRFGFVSSAQVGKLCLEKDAYKNLPMYGYFHGKSRAEEALRTHFSESHLILRPGFIYGKRNMGPLTSVPLQYAGGPLSYLCTQVGPFSKLIQSIPFVGTEASSMVPVESVAKAAIEGLLLEPPKAQTLDAKDIRTYS